MEGLEQNKMSAQGAMGLVKSSAEFYSKYSMANRNYEALARTVTFSQRDRYYNIKAFFTN